MKKIILSVILFSFITSLQAATLVQQRPDVQRFISMMVSKHHFDKVKLTQWFNTIKTTSSRKEKKHSVIHRMNHQHAFLPWYKYHPIFLNDTRIDLGVKYWEKNKKWLNKANKIYGVPQSIIVATIGAESKYGQQAGSFPVFSSLAVLTFDYPKRQRFFKKELIAFLLYCKKNSINPLSIDGSYAGAIGQPQFMPSNIEAYGVDFDHSGKVDLIHDDADVIASIANFYKHNHWYTGKPVATPAIFKTKKAKQFLKKFHLSKVLPRLSLSHFKKLGIYPKDLVKGNLKARLLTLQTKNGPIYWLIFHNFYVIKNYNNSTNYAMSIYQLSLLIKAKYRVYTKQHSQRTQDKHF